MIFSSKIIPGNEKKIFRLFNIFVKSGVEVITERDHFVHVSGHPSVDELQKMYSLIRPNICIPVHGEPVHIHEHVKLAKKNGIKQAVEVENGSVVLLEPNNAKVIAKVESGYLAVDGNYLLPVESPIFKARRRMRESGIVIASIVIDQKGLLAAKPILSMPGLLDANEDMQLINIIKNDIAELIKTQQSQAKKALSKEQIEEKIKSTIRKTLKQEINKSLR